MLEKNLASTTPATDPCLVAPGSADSAVARGFLPLRFTRKDVYAHQVVTDVLRALERWGVSKSDTKAATSTECV